MSSRDKEWNIIFRRVPNNNPVKKNMDKFHKPKTHRDKTKYTRKGKVTDESKTN